MFYRFRGNRGSSLPINVLLFVNMRGEVENAECQNEKREANHTNLGKTLETRKKTQSILEV